MEATSLADLTCPILELLPVPASSPGTQAPNTTSRSLEPLTHQTAQLSITADHVKLLSVMTAERLGRSFTRTKALAQLLPEEPLNSTSPRTQRQAVLCSLGFGGTTQVNCLIPNLLQRLC